MSFRAAAVPRLSPPLPGLSAAVVAAVLEPGLVELCLDTGPTVNAAVAVPGYAPSPGDRVVFAGAEGERYVIGVLSATVATLPLDGGASVTVREGRAEIRDAAGGLLVRYAGGEAHVAAPAGDLVLAAPTGKVVLRAGVDVEVHASRDIKHEALRSVELRAGAARAPQLRADGASTALRGAKLDVEAKVAKVTAEQASVLAGRLTTVAEGISICAETVETRAQRVVEKARDVLRSATDLLETRAGRARTLVQGLYALRAQRTTLASKDDTSIDGKRVLLG